MRDFINDFSSQIPEHPYNSLIVRIQEGRELKIFGN